MLELKVTIEAPGLSTAINRLADAIAYSRAPVPLPSTDPANPTPGAVGGVAPTAGPLAPPAPAAPVTGPTASPSNGATTNPTQAGFAAPAQTGAPAAPMAGPTSAFPSNPYPGQAPAAAPGPVAPAAPTAAPAQATGVPLAPAPQYTVDQIMQAGATLMDAGKVNELMNLLHSFGVQAVMDLKPEQLGAFATAMRGLGAKI